MPNTQSDRKPAMQVEERESPSPSGTRHQSPSDPRHRKLRQLCCLRRRFDCYRVERTSSRAGVAPAEVQRLFTAHYFNNYRRESEPALPKGGRRTDHTDVGSLSLRLNTNSGNNFKRRRQSLCQQTYRKNR
jgi:AraC-like DNA-binding protein